MYSHQSDDYSIRPAHTWPAGPSSHLQLLWVYYLHRLTVAAPKMLGQSQDLSQSNTQSRSASGSLHAMHACLISLQI